MDDKNQIESSLKWLNQLSYWHGFARNKWKWLGWVLTSITFVYVTLLLIKNWGYIQHIDWQHYMFAIVAASIIYLFSLLLQLFVWLRLLSQYHSIGWQDVHIYMRTVMLRQLPGGIFHWVGRGAMYKSTTAVSPQIIFYASLLDWCLILVTALGVFSLFSSGLTPILRWTLFSFSVALMLIFSRMWFSSRQGGRFLFEGVFWSLAYCGSWFLGGVILYLLMQASESSQVSLTTAVLVWVLAGGISALVIITPTGLGIRELSLVFLLQPFMSASLAVLLALMLRLLFILSDLLWGAIGGLLTRPFISKMEKTQQITLK